MGEHKNEDMVLNSLTGKFRKYLLTGAAVCCCLVPMVTAKPLKVGIMNFPPFLVVQNDTIGGTELGRLKQVLQLQKIEFSIAGFPHKRLYNNIKNGSIDLILASKTHQAYSEETIYSKIPIKTLELRLYTHGETPLLKSREEWVGKEFIIINGLGYGGLLTHLEAMEQQKLITLFKNTRHENAVNMLIARRADYLLDYKAPTTAALKTLGIEDALPYTVVYKVDIHVILGKHVENGRELLNRIEEGYQEIPP